MSGALRGECGDRGDRPDRVLQGVGAARELQLACEAVRPRSTMPGLAPGDVDGMVTFTMDASEEIDVARNLGIGDLSLLQPGATTAAGRRRAPSCTRRWPSRPVSPRWWCATAHSMSVPGSASAAAGEGARRRRCGWRHTHRSDC